MFDVNGWVLPILIGLSSAIAVWFHSERDWSLPETQRVLHKVTFGLPIRLITASLLPITCVILFESVQVLLAGRFAPALAAASLFSAITGFHVYQVFFVRFAYDRSAIYFDSPFCKQKTVSWDSLSMIGSSVFAQADYLEFDGVGRIWCFPFCEGHKNLDGFLQSKSSELLESRS